MCTPGQNMDPCCRVTTPAESKLVSESSQYDLVRPFVTVWGAPLRSVVGRQEGAILIVLRAQTGLQKQISHPPARRGRDPMTPRHSPALPESRPRPRHPRFGRHGEDVARPTRAAVTIENAAHDTNRCLNARVAGTPGYTQYAFTLPPCDASHLTPRADPPGIRDQTLIRLLQVHRFSHRDRPLSHPIDSGKLLALRGRHSPHFSTKVQLRRLIATGSVLMHTDVGSHM